MVIDLVALDMNEPDALSVLFLGTGNSARSQIADAIEHPRRRLSALGHHHHRV